MSECLPAVKCWPNFLAFMQAHIISEDILHQAYKQRRLSSFTAFLGIPSDFLCLSWYTAYPEAGSPHSPITDILYELASICCFDQLQYLLALSLSLFLLSFSFLSTDHPLRIMLSTQTTTLSNTPSSTATCDVKRRYQCNVCLKWFSRPTALRTHTYIHTGEKPFECSMYKSFFSWSIFAWSNM